MPENVTRLIGHTPLIAVRYCYADGPIRHILVKCEQYNLTGSIKDRVALYNLEQAREQRRLHPGDLVLAAVDGHCGISFAAVGKALGYRVKVILPASVSLERQAAIKNCGAEIELTENMGLTIQRIETAGHYDGIYFTRLCDNAFAEVHEQTTGREIGHRLLLEELKPSAFIAGAGSGSTLRGVGSYLQKLFPSVQKVQLIAEGQRVDGFDPVCLRTAEALNINDGDAILMSQKIAAELQLGVGISSGANLLGTIRWQQQNPLHEVVVTLFPDGSKYYRSTDLFREEPRRFGYLSPEIRLLGYEVLNKI